MGKKKRNDDSQPGGMSRRQAKLARRAAERAALEKNNRPFAGLACEAQLIAMQEFVPSATVDVTVGADSVPVTLCTVLPGAVAGIARDEQSGSGRYVALQVQRHGTNPADDLAYALSWAITAEPGTSLGSTAADGSQPDLESLLDKGADLHPVAHQDFNWWLPENAKPDAQADRGLRAANDSIIPSLPVEANIDGVCWWVDAGDKAHIRWIRTDNEDKLLTALARIGARGELKLGEETKFAGVFRTHGVIVPVFDLDRTVAADSYADKLEALNAVIAEEIANDAQLTGEERRYLDNIKSRQVTIR